MKKLTHLNEQGRAKMVDISEKQETVRTAHAISSILVSKEVYEKSQAHRSKKEMFCQ